MCINFIVYMSCVLHLQWLQDDFLGYLSEWEHSVSQRAGFIEGKSKMLLSTETRHGIEVTGEKHIFYIYCGL